MRTFIKIHAIQHSTRPYLVGHDSLLDVDDILEVWKEDEAGTDDNFKVCARISLKSDGARLIVRQRFDKIIQLLLKSGVEILDAESD